MLNLGGLNVVRAMRAARIKYWTGAHDEAKKGSEIVSSVLTLLRRKAWTVEEALEAERNKYQETGTGREDPLRYFVLGSGESLRLE
jgi:hypothetical protein